MKYVTSIEKCLNKSSTTTVSDRRSLADLSRAMFDPSVSSRFAKYTKCFLVTWPTLEPSNPSAPSRRHPARPAKPSIRPQFLLAAKPQTYKGGSRAGGSESAAHGFDTAMRAAIPRPPSSTIPHPFQSSVACLELLFLPQYARVCVCVLCNMYTENVHVCTCTWMYGYVCRCSDSG